jgi:pre-mRNA-splicing factor SYF1
MPATPAQRLEALLAGVDHCAHEAEVTRNPFSVKAWLAYLEAKNDSAHGERRLIFERALRLVPRSYKLWYAYLGELEVAVRDRWTTSGRAKTLVGAYERALLSCSKFPRIWLDYLACLRKMGLGSEVRRAFDRCLMALPITQHHHVWPEYVAWASDFGVVEAAVIAHRRWVMYEPNGREAFVDYLAAQGRHGDAIVELVKICEDDDFASPSGKSRHQPGQHKRAKFPTSKPHISAVFHSFWLIFGRAIISRSGLEAWMLLSERARAEHSR